MEEEVVLLAVEVESVVGCEAEVERDAAFAVEVDIVVGVDAEVEVNREEADGELDSLLEEEGPEADSEFPPDGEVLAVEDGFTEDEELEDDSTEEEDVLAGDDIDEDDNDERGDGEMLNDEDPVLEADVLDEVFDAEDDDNTEDGNPVIDDVALDDVLDNGEEDVEDRDLVEIALLLLLGSAKAGLITAAASQMKAILPCIFLCILRRGYVQ